jgi:hypothetical protein
MANLFTPEPSTSIAFEQPVAPVQEPSLLQGLASTADSFLKATVSGSKGSGSGSKVDPNLLKEFSIQAQQVKSIEDSKGSAAGSLARKKMLTAWNAQGIDTSDDAFSTIWGSTGLGEWKKRAESSVEAQQNEFLKGATGQAFYIAELGRSAPGTPDSLVRQNALLAASKFELAAKTVATTKLMDNAQFAANGGAEHITSFLKETADISISGALDAVAKGAPVTEGAILQLKALIGEVYRQNMPANVTDEELLKPYTKEYERIVSQLDTIQASVSSGILKSGLTAEIVAKAKGAGLSASETMSFISLVSSDSALLKDSTTRDRLLKAFKATDAKVWQSKQMEDYTKAATKKANGNSPDLPGAPVSDAVKQRMEEIGKLDQPGAEALYDIRMKQLANSDVNTEEGAEAWQRAAMDMGIMLQSTGTGLLPEDVMSRVFNEKFFSNFDKLYAKDPYKASIVAGSVREGLQREAEHHDRLLSSMEEKFPFVTVDESGGYRITPEMLEKHFGTKTSPVERATFMAATEGGNLEAVFAKGSWGKAQDDLPHFPGMVNVLKLSAQRRNLRQAEKHVGTIVDIINKRHAGSLPVDETLGAEKPSLLQRSLSTGFATRNVKASAAVVQDNPLYQPLIDMGVPASELQGVVTGESGGRTSVKNPDGSASGIFQITEDAAKDLGTTTEKIRAMSEVEQVALYGKYLKRWGYKPGIPLAIMQAAPSKAKGWDGTDEYVLYEKGTSGWEQNPAWRDKLNNDDVTVGSVKKYFKGNEASLTGGEGQQDFKGGEGSDRLVPPLPPKRPISLGGTELPSDLIALADDEFSSVVTPYLEGNPLAKLAMADIEKNGGISNSISTGPTGHKTGLRGLFNPQTDRIKVAAADLDVTKGDFERFYSDMTPVTVAHELTHKGLHMLREEGLLKGSVVERVLSKDDTSRDHGRLINYIDVANAYTQGHFDPTNEDHVRYLQSFYSKWEIGTGLEAAGVNIHSKDSVAPSILGKSRYGRSSDLKRAMKELDTVVKQAMVKKGFSSAEIEAHLGKDKPSIISKLKSWFTK